MSLAADPKMSVLTANKALYYGFWGQVYNSVQDAAVPEFYQLLQEFIERAQDNFGKVFDAFQADENAPKQKKPALAQVITTLTDSQAKRVLPVDTFELQGSIKQLICGRNCVADPQEINGGFRFPIDLNGLVEDVATAVGQSCDEAGYLFQSPIQGLIERELLMMSKPVKKKVVVEKPKEKPKKDDKKKKVKKAKKSKVLDPAGYVKQQIESSSSEEEEVDFKPFQQVVSSMHPKCKFCQAPLRFGIFPVKIPAQAKSFFSNVAKLVVQELQPSQQQVISSQHNDYQTKKTQSAVKTVPNYHFILLEIGFSTNYKKVHEENLKAIMAAKGNGFLIRIAKPSEDARKFGFDGMDAVKTNLQLDPSFSLDNQCYLIEVDNLRQGVIELMEVYKDRDLWITDWDDVKKRNDRYFPKKK
uniref:Uncharacterized protein n=1 Tax=Trepomonas sp. PC1 TaxID=1076344 RepID=A0A146K1R6_9EUKA|eukprot:JAP90832.1 hypothetical protein TPC1_17753 [Trepomonas sp. PC1]